MRKISEDVIFEQKVRMEEGILDFFKKALQFVSRKLLKRNKYIVDFDFDISDSYSTADGDLVGYYAYLDDGREIRLNYLMDGSSKSIYSVDLIEEDDTYDRPSKTIILDPDASFSEINDAIEDLISNNLQENVPYTEEEKKLIERVSPAKADVYAWIEDPEMFDARIEIIQDEKLSRVYGEYARTTDSRPVSQASFITYVKKYLNDNGMSNKWTRGAYTVKKSSNMTPIETGKEKSYVKDMGNNSEMVFSWKEAFEDMEDDFQDLMDDPNGMPFGQLVYGNGGTGKAQPLYSKVLTPTGFTTMGEIKVGDKVLTPNGETVEVLKTFPQEGLREVYEIVFADGSKVRCDKNHLWKVYYQGNTNKMRVKTLEDIMKSKLKNENKDGSWTWSVPLLEKPIEFIRNDNLIVDAYLLGFLLGDGCFRADYPTFTTIDSQIKEKVSDIVNKMGCSVSVLVDGLTYGIKNTIHRGRGGKNILKEKLEQIGIWGTKSEDKFIPNEYKTGSVEQRLSIIQGLMDSDGTIDKKSGSVSILLKSERLIKDIKEIIKSLGGWASITETIKKYDYINGEKEGTFYNLCFVLPKGISPFSLERKNKYVENKSQYKKGMSIREINYIGEEETKCIMIDSEDHLYITDDFVITHNSFYYVQQSKNFDAMIIKGAPNTSRLVRILYDYRDKEIIIFDDADSIVTNSNSANILKMATDDTSAANNNGSRIIYLPKGSGKDMKGIEPDVYDSDGNLIQAFWFNASIVVITNLPDVKDKALKTRLYLNPIFMSKEDIIEKIMLTVKPEEFGATEIDSKMVADFLITLVEKDEFDISNDQLSYRFFKIGLKLRKRYPNNWTGKLVRKLGIGIKSSYKDLKKS